MIRVSQGAVVSVNGMRGRDCKTISLERRTTVDPRRNWNRTSGKVSDSDGTNQSLLKCECGMCQRALGTLKRELFPHHLKGYCGYIPVKCVGNANQATGVEGESEK